MEDTKIVKFMRKIFFCLAEIIFIWSASSKHSKVFKGSLYGFGKNYLGSYLQEV